MAHSTDRRNFQRISFDADVTVTQSDRCFHSKIIDISLGGILIQSPKEPLDEHTPCDIIIPLSEDVKIHLQATPVYQSASGLGFTIQAQELDDMVHLRRVLELNSDDIELIDRAFSALLPSD